ncbi:hypothetical protein ECG_06266 [Echinococcus granulosus]|uniref:Expressed conserved protein n=1 Tax=Echinococcus granulosus TaxID=6210 RepID=A0A068WMB8_ECHGR|nr:hypothetical protein ECG_06266 [Echinococcus granulosus]CDS19646.1 expressed conserved protein [Echinococcus granulosus]
MPQNTLRNEMLQHFVKHTEAANFRRAAAYKSRKNKSTFVALAATAFAVGSYLFSINAVRQGRFLDESFDKLPNPK